VYKHLVTQETDRVGAITAAYQGALIMRAQITAAEAEKEELQKELQALKRALNENSQRWTKRAGELEAEVARLTRMLQAQTPRSTESEGSAALLRESVRTMERSLAQERMKANFLQAAFAAEQQKANELGMKLALCEAAPSLHRPPSQP
jgi:chromosome segregation ATPase